MTIPLPLGSQRAQTLEQLARLCRNAESGRAPWLAAPSGFAELDANLPGGGWPVGAIAELMRDAIGIGELSLLVPVLSRLARAGRYIAWIAPPYLPYAPALAQRGVPLERLLMIHTPSLQESLVGDRAGAALPAVGAVLGWPATSSTRMLRRLQLAAEAGGSLGILYRPPEAAHEASPAALRLRLHAPPRGPGGRDPESRGGACRPDAAGRSRPTAATSNAGLWLCIRLPQLALKRSRPPSATRSNVWRHGPISGAARSAIGPADTRRCCGSNSAPAATCLAARRIAGEDRSRTLTQLGYSHAARSRPRPPRPRC